MRVTPQTKLDTRQRILDRARRLLNKKGYDATTTRDLARAADIAIGTLFNYFRTKEDLAMTLLADAADEARTEFRNELRPDASLDEALFAHVAVELRHLRPYRAFVGDTLDAALSPFSAGGTCEAAERFRLHHLETARELLAAATAPQVEPAPLAMHLYWSLYLGVLSYWASDPSPNQEDTLVLLDQSLRLFVASLARVVHHQTEDQHEHQSC